MQRSLRLPFLGIQVYLRQGASKHPKVSAETLVTSCSLKPSSYLQRNNTTILYVFFIHKRLKTKGKVRP